MVSILSTNLSSLIRTTGFADQLQLHECLKNMTEFLKTCNCGDKIRINDTFIKLQLVVAMSHGITMSLCGDTYKNLTRDVLDEMLGKNSEVFKHFVST